MVSVPRLLRPRWLLLHAGTATTAAAFGWLGWWQLSKAEWHGGDWQNLSYAVQWPLFAAFVIFCWWRFIHDRNVPLVRIQPRGVAARGARALTFAADARRALPGAPGGRDDVPRATDDGIVVVDSTATEESVRRRRFAGRPVSATRTPAPQRIAEDVPDEEIDAATAAYNRYLVSLYHDDTSDGSAAKSGSGPDIPHPDTAKEVRR